MGGSRLDDVKVALKGWLRRAGVVVSKPADHDHLTSRARRGDRYPVALGELEAVWRRHAFVGLPERERRVELLAELQGTQPTEAIHLLAWLHETSTLDGVVCEMGCAHGATSALIANELLGDDRQLWLFDSFRGLSRPTEEDVLIDDIFDKRDMDAYEGTMAYPESEVRARLGAVGFPEQRTHVVAGYVPDSLERPGLPERVAFAYVDFDLYRPIRHGLDWLHERLAPGGIVMIDDYGWFSAGAQRAVDEFVAEHVDSYQVRNVDPWVGHFVALVRNDDPR